MADKTPVRATFSGSVVIGLQEFEAGDTIPLSILGGSPAKGDLIAGDGSGNWVKFTPVGADGTVLTADSAETEGVRWGPSSGVTISIIDGQPVPTFIDNTRANKVVSIETVTFMWAENIVSNNDWLNIGGTSDAAIGHVMPHNSTIIKITAKTTDNNGNSKDLDLYVDDVLDTSSIASFSGAPGEDEFTDVTLNIDISAGEKIQLRGDAAGGSIDDTTVTLFVKWRV